MNVYHPRKPELSKLWKCFREHFSDFLRDYHEKYEKKYGFFRSIISEVVEKYLDCGFLTKGFARVKCPDCKHSFLLAFSCRGRWFCPSCHEKKVVLFGEFISESVAFPVPHCQYV